MQVKQRKNDKKRNTTTPRGNAIRASEDPRAISSPKPVQNRHLQGKISNSHVSRCPGSICYTCGRFRFACAWLFCPPRYLRYCLRLTVSTSHMEFNMTPATPQSNEIRASEDPRAISSPKPLQNRHLQGKSAIHKSDDVPGQFAILAVGSGSLVPGCFAHPGTYDIAWDKPSLQATWNST